MQFNMKSLVSGVKKPYRISRWFLKAASTWTRLQTEIRIYSSCLDSFIKPMPQFLYSCSIEFEEKGDNSLDLDLDPSQIRVRSSRYLPNRCLQLFKFLMHPNSKGC